MAKAADKVLRLLLIEDSVEDAEQVISVLRNAGIAVRPNRVEDGDQLKAALESTPTDLVLLSPKAKKIGLSEAAAIVSRSAKDLCLLQLADTLTQELVLKSLKEGARDVALRTVPDHLKTIALREYENLTTRRNLRKFEAAWRESERRAHSLLDSSRDPIAYVHEGMHIYANRAYLEMFNFEEFDEIEGLAILDLISSRDGETFRNVLRTISKGEKPPERLNVQAQRADGSTFDAVMELAEASIEGEPATQIIFRQQTVSAELAEQLDALKRQDLVTGLYNRQHFLTELERAVAAAIGGKVEQALLYVEIDNYRKVLDQIGVSGADLLLGDVATLLKSIAGEHDVLARFADHSFTVISVGRSHEAAAQFAEQIRKRFEERIFDVGQRSVSLNASVGVCFFTEKVTGAAMVLEKSNEACRNAQKEGGNRIVIFDPAAQDKADAAKDKEWVDRIKAALEKDKFILFYQPIVSLQGAEGEFYEVLLRLEGPSGEILPGQFLPPAERFGFLPQIDRWVIDHVIRVLQERIKQGRNTTFFIKLTPPAIEDGTLLPWLAQQLKAARVPGDKLVFEMPESKVVTHLKQAKFFQKGLEQLRCGFALEQFGSGLNSFQLLKHVSANYIKLDRTYMNDLAKSQENQQRIRDMCEQARGLGRMTVAEFVEDAASMSILFQVGVNFVQGNFLQEPQKTMSYDFG
jgi:diguanylate cyclase (GGDEF)-like protein/PAS domain S-box-containing protein